MPNKLVASLIFLLVASCAVSNKERSVARYESDVAIERNLKADLPFASVENGIVHLSGCARSAEEIAQAEIRASQAAGVSGVRNSLKLCKIAS